MSHHARLLVNLSLKNTHSDNSCFEDAKRRKITYPQEIADHSGNDFDSDDSVKDPDYHRDEDIANNQFYTAMAESEEEENSEDTNVFNNDQDQQSENSEPDAAVQKKRTMKDRQINKN
ncbi:hypothetical protein ANN_06435 [Periplaneta americana]|uniref:Uncharacterized protein n=1 Tax=Periplaneta americana TaxID=6978 RepID=A0ABQ8TDP7_PERAM|nr:hypothetical protein ANN_06435 [Periplaneta americana]